jgi:eukaryotic-like serine/threonine-protein kinase
MASTASARLTDIVASRYEIVRRLGAGPAATAYLARDLSQDRLVTLKMLHIDPKGFLDTSVLDAKRLLANLRAAGQLKHSQILAPLDAGADRRTVFYVLPYVDGEPLSGRLRRQGALPVADALYLLREIAEALAYTHARGQVHGDISSDSVLMSGRRAFLQDFALARPDEAPAEPADARLADIRGFGGVAYEMLAGRAPFAAESIGAGAGVAAAQRLEPLLAAQPGVPPALASLVTRCLEAGPATPWPTADAIVSELNGIARFLEMTPAEEPAPAHFMTAGNWLAVGLMLIGIASLAYLLLRDASSIVLPRAGRVVHVTTDAGVELDPALSPDGRLVAYAAGTLGETRIHLRPIAGGRSTSVPAIPGAMPQRWPAWSPDGSRVLFQAGRRAGTAGIATADASIWIVPARGGTAVRLTTEVPGGLVASSTWSPDGKQIAFSASDGIYLLPDGGGEMKKLATAGAVGSAHALQWSPDGKRIAYVSGARAFTFIEEVSGPPETSSIHVVNVAGGDVVQVTTGEWLDVSPVWTPDGQSLLFVSNRGGGRDVYRVRLESAGAGAPERMTSGLNAHTISLSREGRQLAYSTFARRPNVLDEGDIWVMALVARSP